MNTETATAPTVISAFEAMKTRARAQPTQTLVEAVTLIGGSHTVSDDAKIARAVMLDVIEEREGEEFVDLVLDTLGM